MNVRRAFGDQMPDAVRVLRRQTRAETAMSGIASFLIAVGVVSSIIFLLSQRADRGRGRRRAYADSTEGSTGGTSTGDDGFSLMNWFSGSSSSSEASCTSSSSSLGGSDSSCSDGGGDSGGGGDGGGD